MDNQNYKLRQDKAFPNNNNLSSLHDDGMDLRDYFAIKILQGYISYAGWHPDFEMAFPQEYAEKGKTADVLPNVCYRFADAMMKAREK